jgi:hypothetical protein
VKNQKFLQGPHSTLSLPLSLSLSLIQIRNGPEGLGPISAHGGRKVFSPTLLVVVEGKPSPPYIYIGRAAP